MREHYGLAFLGLTAAATGRKLLLVPQVGGTMRATLDPGGLNLFWEGPLDGAEEVILRVLRTHDPSPLEPDQSMTLTAREVPGLDMERAKALSKLLQISTSSSGWASLAVIAMPAHGGVLLFTGGDMSHPVLEQAGERIRDLGPEINITGGQEVADA